MFFSFYPIRFLYCLVKIVSAVGGGVVGVNVALDDIGVGVISVVSVVNVVIGVVVICVIGVVGCTKNRLGSVGHSSVPPTCLHCMMERSWAPKDFLNSIHLRKIS